MVRPFWLLLMLLLMLLAGPTESSRDEVTTNAAMSDAVCYDEEPVALVPIVDTELRAAIPADPAREGRVELVPAHGEVFRPPRPRAETSIA